MRRARQRQPGPLFRGGEMVRLATMLVMLAVVGMLVFRAREASTWRWLVHEPAEQPATDPRVVPAAAPAGTPQAAAPELAADLDPEERDAAREELTAVGDKTALGKEEMPAYWRLLGWVEKQPLDDLERRAQRDVSFRQLWEQPERWRGKLVELTVHLKQTAAVDDLPENPLGLKHLVEAWGWNNDSQPYTYWFVCPELPPGMPAGQNLAEEATFVGYFLKLNPYEDHEGVRRATPLLIGRLVWHPTAESPLSARAEWEWLPLAGVALVALLALRVWGRFAARRARSRSSGTEPRLDEQAVSAWLEGAEHRATADDERDGRDETARNGK